MKKILLIVISLLLLVLFTFWFLGSPLKEFCPNSFHWFPTPRCVISLDLGEFYKDYEFTLTGSGEYPDCDKVEKGLCTQSFGPRLEIDGLIYQTATVTPKGFEIFK